MNKMTLVSIITCFLDLEPYLEETIKRILGQTYGYWVLLLIDDGSKGGSTEIAKDFAFKYPKIYYYKHEVHNTSRNLAIDKASSETMAFLDGDEICLPSFVKESEKTVLKNSVSMYGEATNHWFTRNKSKKEDAIIPVGVIAEKIYFPPELKLKLYLWVKGLHHVLVQSF